MRVLKYICVVLGCLSVSLTQAAEGLVSAQPSVEPKVMGDTIFNESDSVSATEVEELKSYFEMRAGYQIGGTVPFPLPAQMRKINGFSPLGNFSVQALGVVPIGKRWEFALGVKFERKGMTAEATVKDYNMSIQDEDGGVIMGRWTGGVTMTADQWFLTMPFSCAFKITEVGKIRVGVFYSYLSKGEFYGEVYNGYLREGDPTGAKIEVDDKPQSFNFSPDLKRFQWGLSLGGEWRLYKRLSAFVDLDWGLSDIFVDDFETITFDMFPIYGTIGLGYSFK